LKYTGVDGNNILGIAITTQRETLIPVDSQGADLRDAIIWLDGRAVSRKVNLFQKNLIPIRYIVSLDCQR
jgi:sugar (pentulose or hexulose) kinase